MSPRRLRPLLTGGLTLILATSCFAQQPAAAPVGSNGSAGSEPRVTEANITKLTTALLEQSQFLHRQFDPAMAATFLDRYLDVLDGSRTLFLKSDVDELVASGSQARQVPTEMREAGDTRLAQTIFQRYLARLQERTAFQDQALKSATFDFTGHDTYSYDREHATRPETIADAHLLWQQQLRAEYLQEKLGDKTPAAIALSLTKKHAQQLQTTRAMTSDDVVDLYLNALVHVYDPHSDYLGREEMESFAIAMKLSLAGIGATLEATDSGAKIRELVPGGPAARDGTLKAGDTIVAVAQQGKDPVDITNMPLGHAVELIRGKKGSTVVLSVLAAKAPEGAAPVAVRVVRDDIKLEDQEAKARIVDLPGKTGATVRLGVIDLPSFYAASADSTGAGARSSTADVARLVTKLKSEGVRGIALDLRHNPGGSLEEAISLTGLFIKKGPVVQTRDQAGAIEVDADKDPAVLYDGPLVVLTSRFSASASEIVAGALQDYGRAVVIGDPSTFGKGTVQNVLPLGRIMDQYGLAHAFDPGALKLTTMKFYRPGGASTQLRGVSSDIVVPSDTDLKDVSESAMKNPLPWDAVPVAPHDALDLVQPYLSTLRARSTERVANDAALRDVHQDGVRLGEKLAAKSISLNEADRRREIAQAKTDHEAREKEERGLASAHPTTYLITLANARAAGLPAPEKKAPPGRAALADDHDRERADAEHERTADDDAVLYEDERILGDYVGAISK